MFSAEQITAIFAGVVAVMSAPGVLAWFKAREAAIQARRSVHEANDNSQTILNSIAKISVAINGRVTQLLEGKDQVNQAQAESIRRLERIVAELIAGRTAEAAALLRTPLGTPESPLHVAIDATPAPEGEQAGGGATLDVADPAELQQS